MTSRGARALVVAGLLVAGTTARAAATDKPQIVGLAVTPAAGGMTVSFRVDPAFTEEVLERVASGMEVEFRHRIELLVRRTIPLWPSRVLTRADISVTIRFDSLTRQYRLTRTTERRLDGKAVDEPVEIEESFTPSQEEAKAWMTRVDALKLDLPDEVDADRTTRLHVRSWLGRRYRFYLFPMADAAEAEQELAK